MKTSKFKTKNPLYFAVVLGLIIVTATTLYTARERQKLGLDTNDEFNVEAVLPPSITQPPADQVFSLQDVQAANGKDSNDCLVAISGVVYEVTQGRLWQNGEHTTSNGQASCGADLTEVLGQSPHGPSKLEDTTQVGTLAN